MIDPNDTRTGDLLALLDAQVAALAAAATQPVEVRVCTGPVLTPAEVQASVADVMNAHRGRQLAAAHSREAVDVLPPPTRRRAVTVGPGPHPVRVGLPEGVEAGRR